MYSTLIDLLFLNEICSHSIKLDSQINRNLHINDDVNCNTLIWAFLVNSIFLSVYCKYDGNNENTDPDCNF